MNTVLRPVNDLWQSVSENELVTQIEQRMIDLLTSDENNRNPHESDTPRQDAAHAAAYHLGTGGQRLRARLCTHAGIELNLSEENIISLGAACELIHNASLIHDDIQDRAEFRRGEPTVWATYGDGIALCAGDLLLSAAYRSLANVGQPSVISALLKKTHEKIALVIRGQCADIEATHSPVTELRQYEKVVIAKSGALLGLPFELCLITANMSDWLRAIPAFVEPFALGYQILDDIRDIGEDTSKDTKASSLNFILVAERNNTISDTVKYGYQLAHSKFLEAAENARLLPYNMGTRIAEISLQMAKQANT
jgi:geranylgeranyl pyrophosphate synthase